ncbi:hypothetical protein BU15DRAFT_80462 [Melanogaster broomeanus]|nr:hypothetical protein BU15DRAFT_80462 [Melanogaster broomeanus]
MKVDGEKKLAQIQRAEVKKRETLECNAAKRAQAKEERACKREERKALPKKPRPSRGKNNVLVTSEVQNSISTPLSMPIPGPFIHQHHVHSHHDVLDLVDDPNGTDDSGDSVSPTFRTLLLPASTPRPHWQRGTSVPLNYVVHHPQVNVSTPTTPLPNYIPIHPTPPYYPQQSRYPMHPFPPDITPLLMQQRASSSSYLTTPQ